MKQSSILKISLVIGTIILIALILSKWCFQLTIIQGESMYPAFHHLQMVILDKRGQKIERGDVVAFYSEGLKSVLVKRVAALPGDFVQISGGILFVNYVAVSEQIISYEGIAKDGIQLSQQEYFTLGDNLEMSKDSRYKEVGCLNKKDIIGKVYP